MKVMQNMIKGIEEMAEYLAKNSVRTSVPVFSYKVKPPDGIEEHIQLLKARRNIECIRNMSDKITRY